MKPTDQLNETDLVAACPHCSHRAVPNQRMIEVAIAREIEHWKKPLRLRCTQCGSHDGALICLEASESGVATAAQKWAAHQLSVYESEQSFELGGDNANLFTWIQINELCKQSIYSDPDEFYDASQLLFDEPENLELDQKLGEFESFKIDWDEYLRWKDILNATFAHDVASYNLHKTHIDDGFLMGLCLSSEWFPDQSTIDLTLCPRLYSLTLFGDSVVDRIVLPAPRELGAIYINGDVEIRRLENLHTHIEIEGI